VQSRANLDPENYFGKPLRDAVLAGRVPQSRIDDSIRRQLRSLFAIGVIDNPPTPGQPIAYSLSRLVAQRAAEAGIVLLKNDHSLLPLAMGAKRILVIGRYAVWVQGEGEVRIDRVGGPSIPGGGGIEWLRLGRTFANAGDCL
jgi:beta-glucosidase